MRLSSDQMGILAALMRSGGRLYLPTPQARAELAQQAGISDIRTALHDLVTVGLVVWRGQWLALVETRPSRHEVRDQESL